MGHRKGHGPLLPGGPEKSWVWVSPPSLHSPPTLAQRGFENHSAHAFMSYPNASSTHPQLPDGCFRYVEWKKDNPPKMECLCKGTSYITCVMGCTAQCNYGQGLGNMDLGSLAPGLRVRGPLDAK